MIQVLHTCESLNLYKDDTLGVDPNKHPSNTKVVDQVQMIIENNNDRNFGAIFG